MVRGERWEGKGRAGRAGSAGGNGSRRSWPPGNAESGPARVEDANATSPRGCSRGSGRGGARAATGSGGRAGGAGPGDPQPGAADQGQRGGLGHGGGRGDDGPMLRVVARAEGGNQPARRQRPATRHSGASSLSGGDSSPVRKESVASCPGRHPAPPAPRRSAIGPGAGERMAILLRPGHDSGEASSRPIAQRQAGSRLEAPLAPPLLHNHRPPRPAGMGGVGTKTRG